MLELKPDHGGALKYRALTYVRLKQFDKASADIDRALSIQPDERTYLYVKGLIAHHLGNTAEAMEWYSRALDGKFYEEPLVERVKLYMAAGEYQKALDDCGWIIKHRPTASNKLRRAGALLKLGRKEDAYWDYASAARTDINNVKPIVGLGDFFLFHEVDLRQAIAYYTAAIEEFAEPPTVYLHRGMAYAALEPPLFAKKALNDFNNYIRLEPQAPEGYAERAKLYLSTNKRDKALADIRTALELDADNEEYNKTLDAINAAAGESKSSQ